MIPYYNCYFHFCLAKSFIQTLRKAIFRLLFNSSDLDPSFFNQKDAIFFSLYLTSWFFCLVPYSQVVICNRVSTNLQFIDPMTLLGTSCNQ